MPLVESHHPNDFVTSDSHIDISLSLNALHTDVLIYMEGIWRISVFWEVVK